MDLRSREDPMDKDRPVNRAVSTVARVLGGASSRYFGNNFKLQRPSEKIGCLEVRPKVLHGQVRSSAIVGFFSIPDRDTRSVGIDDAVVLLATLVCQPRKFLRRPRALGV